jgi:hypothetical protein
MDPVLMRRLARMADSHDDVVAAVKQLETQMGSIGRDIHSKLSMVRNAAWNGDGSYCGIFGGEEEARAFGLFVLSQQADPREAEAYAAKLRSVLPTYDRRDMSSNPDASGGSLVPIEFSDRIKHLIESYGVLARNAFQMPMSGDKLTFLKQTGEVSVYVPGESNAPGDSEPNFKSVNLTNKEYCTLTFVPRNLGDDAIAVVGELVGRSMAYAMALKWDQIGFNGDGSATYFNITGIIPKLTNINGVDDGGGIVLGSGNAYSELTLGDFEKVQGRLADEPLVGVGDRVDQDLARGHAGFVRRFKPGDHVLAVVAIEHAGHRPALGLAVPVGRRARDDGAAGKGLVALGARHALGAGPGGALGGGADVQWGNAVHQLRLPKVLLRSSATAMPSMVKPCRPSRAARATRPTPADRTPAAAACLADPCHRGSGGTGSAASPPGDAATSSSGALARRASSCHTSVTHATLGLAAGVRQAVAVAFPGQQPAIENHVEVLGRVVAVGVNAGDAGDLPPGAALPIAGQQQGTLPNGQPGDGDRGDGQAHAGTAFRACRT